MKYLLVTISALTLLLSACTKKKTDTYERFYFQNEGANIAVEVNGNMASKTFILLLHGGPGSGGAIYNSGWYAQELEKDYAMVYMDQRGNGASQGNYKKDALTIAQNSRDVYALSLFLKKKYGEDISLFLAGHSWGGLTSCHALISTDIQKELKGWIEMDGAHDFNKNDVEAVKFFKLLATENIANNKSVDFWTPVLERVSTMDTNNITSADQGYLNSTAFNAEKHLPLVNSNLSGPSAYGLLTSPDTELAGFLCNTLGNPILNEDSQKNPLTSRLGEITIPCQFLWGKYDLVVPPALGYSAFNLVNTTDKEIHIFEGSGHSPMANEPEAFVAAMKGFINAHK